MHNRAVTMARATLDGNEQPAALEVTPLPLQPA